MMKLRVVRVKDLPYSPDQSVRLGERKFPLMTLLQGATGPQGEQGDIGPQGIQGPIGPAGSDADTTALREELLGTGGVTVLQNCSYNGSVLTHTSGNLLGAYPGYAAFVPLTALTNTLFKIPAGTGYYIYLSVVAGTVVPESSPKFYLRYAPEISQLSVIVANIADSYAVSAGDVLPVTWDDHSISVDIGGIHTAVGATINDPHFMIMVFTSTGSMPAVEIDLPAAGALGVIGLAVNVEAGTRQAADNTLTNRIIAVESVNTAQNIAISDIQTLAETNQLNISERVLQTDFDSLAEIVTDNGLVLAQKASQADLNNLTTEVSTKATLADISAAIAAVVDGAPGALDTLYKIAGKLAGDEAAINDLLIQISGKVGFDAAQSLTTAQQLQARQNISAEATGVAAALVAAITAASIGAATAAQGAKADSALQSGDVAPVALSGSYTALTDKPTIPAAQVNADWNSNSGLSQILNKPTLFGLSSLLTGLGAGSATAIAAADTLIQALAKLQAQASANAALLAPVPRKVLSGWYSSGRWYDSMYPYSSVISTAGVTVGVLQFQRVFVIETVQVDQLAISVTGAVSGAGCIVGIYSDTGGSPASLIVKSGTLDCSSTGIKQFSTSQTLTAGTIVWLAFLAVGAAGAMFRVVNTSYGVSFSGAISPDVAAVGRLYITGQTDLPATISVTLIPDIAAITPRVVFRAV